MRNVTRISMVWRKCPVIIIYRSLAPGSIGQTLTTLINSARVDFEMAILMKYYYHSLNHFISSNVLFITTLTDFMKKDIPCNPKGQLRFHVLSQKVPGKERNTLHVKN